MDIQRRSDGIQKNFTVGEFLRMQKLGKHELPQGSRASLLEMNIGKDG